MQMDTEAMDKVGERYQPKMKEALEEIRKEALERGYSCCEPYDLSDQTYRWSMLIKPPGMDPDEPNAGVDVTLEIAESFAYDSDPGDVNGVNFSLDVVEYGGQIVSGFQPYNFTPLVWVPESDRDAIEERWTLFMSGFDAADVIGSIDGYYENEKAASHT